MNTQAHNRRNLAGQTYANLEAVELYEIRNQMAYWTCKCKCGSTTIVGLSSWGRTKSCGCLKNAGTHGLWKLYKAEYMTWYALVNRCTNPEAKGYHNYGGRGITVTPHWIGPDGLQNFLDEMGPRPDNDWSIDRIDNDKGYSQCNCRWTRWVTQNRNKRDTTSVTFNGETHSVSRWAELASLSRTNVFNRLRRGWPVAQALGFEPRKK